jgi:hypothetical protein
MANQAMMYFEEYMINFSMIRAKSTQDGDDDLGWGADGWGVL